MGPFLMSQTVLIVEDEASQRLTFSEILEQAGYRVITAKHGVQAMEYLTREDAKTLIDLVLTDLCMPQMGGLELIKQTRALHPNLPIIVLTSSSEISDAIACIRAGAYDFISKPIEPNRLKVSICNTLQAANMHAEIDRLTRCEAGFNTLIGHENGLAQAVEIGKKLATSDLPVLISGESGVGKEAFARALHAQSARAAKPFVAINCSAIPQNLAESVLFGHEKGAFTGAIQKALGKFREAAGGSLFLDEIGELSPETQAKLLRALQNKEIEPVGLAGSVHIDVRIISATHRNLHEAAETGDFREDLFYRLNVLPLHLPPLRARIDDIEPLIDFFTNRLCAREGIMPKTFSCGALDQLKAHDWPGNVRELENCVSRALLLTNNSHIQASDIEPLLHIGKQNTQDNSAASVDIISLTHANGSRKTMEEIDAELLAKTMLFFDDHVPKSATALGIGQSTLYRKLKRKP
jgi:DNA-binding NtrC family response regulator